jgi:very-short-patch-repair endonuclease
MLRRVTEPLGEPVRLAGPFTRAYGRAAGLTDNQLESSRYRRLFHNVWVPSDLEDSRELRLEAARLVIPDRGVLWGLTAAWIYRADVRRLDDYDVHVGFPKDQRIRKRPGLAVCQETLDPSDITRIEGVQITTPLRTAFDCLRLLKGAERIVVADALARLELVQLDELTAYFASKRRLRNLRIGEALLDDVEPKSESPMETRMRVRLVDDGLPRPEAQHNVFDANGRFIGRLDLAYPAAKLGVEYDGAEHWKQRREDDRRRTAIREQGWEVLVYSSDDVYVRHLAMCDEVRRHLRRRTQR